MTKPDQSRDVSGSPFQNVAGCRIWIDGAGCWLLWFDATLTVGRMSSRQGKYCLQLPAPLRTEHATWTREFGTDWLTPLGEIWQNGEPVNQKTRLFSGDDIRWFDNLRWRWRNPSELSESSAVTFGAGRTVDQLDGVVFFSKTCLIGPTQQCHIPARSWNSPVLIFERGQKLFARLLTETEEFELGFDQAISLKHGSMRLEMIS